MKKILSFASLFIFLVAANYNAVVSKGSVKFSINAPAAKSVSIAGDFNNWKTDADAMEGPDAQGNWVLVKKIGPGTYGYKYVIDGTKWIPNGYGKNLTLKIKGIEKAEVKSTSTGINFSYKDKSAQSVQVAGSFNGWKGVAMKKDKTGVWRLSINPAPGKYEYKFLINGKYEQGNNRTINVTKNYKYEFKTRQKGAEIVNLAGDFNNWNKNSIKLDGPDKDGYFTKTLQLKSGKHEYKFLIDGKWLKGDNQIINVGSISAAGEPYSVVTENGKTIFTYNSATAKSVNVVGAFNNWANATKGVINKSIGAMDNSSGKWVLELPLQAGKYEFKFVVDGNKWIGKGGKNIKLEVK